jgi:hypothetical protein
MRDQYDGEPLSSLGKEIAQTFADAGTPKSEPDSALPYNPFFQLLVFKYRRHAPSLHIRLRETQESLPRTASFVKYRQNLAGGVVKGTRFRQLSDLHTTSITEARVPAEPRGKRYVGYSDGAASPIGP